MCVCVGWGDAIYSAQTSFWIVRKRGRVCTFVWLSGCVYRTERMRRWDHLRKTHGLTTCDKCSIRIPKVEVDTHTAACTGDKSAWLCKRASVVSGVCVCMCVCWRAVLPGGSAGVLLHAGGCYQQNIHTATHGTHTQSHMEHTHTVTQGLKHGGCHLHS